MAVYQHESKRAEIESIIKNKTIYGIILIIISLILALPIFLYDIYFINFISVNFDIRMIGSILFLIAFMKGYDFIYNPVNPYEHAFFEIFQAMKIIERPGESEVLNKQARGRVLKAHEKLYSQQVKMSNAPWNSIDKEIEKTFKKNLKTRIAPAIMNNTIETVHLDVIAMALMGNNISLLADVNNRLIKDLDEIGEKKSTIASSIIKITSNNKSLSYIQENKIFRPIIIIIAGFVGITIFCFLYALPFASIKFIELVSNPQIFILGGLAVSTLIQPLLSARTRAADIIVEPPANIVVESPADTVVELPADVDEIDLPEPSFPSDRWEFLWFRYTEDKRNPWGDFIAQTSKTELNFDEDWGKGIVNNSGLSNNVGFIASRTIRLNDAGRYTFLIGGDDGIRLYVYNDNLTETFLGINEWNDQPYSQFERTITLPAGEYKLLLEWYEHYDNARASFKLRECETDDEVRASRGLPPHTFSVEWHLSGAVMPVPPWGSRDIPNSDSASELIVQQLEGEYNVKIICDMRGLRPKARYRLAVENSYTPHSEWPGEFSDTIPPISFVTDSEGCGKKEFNLRSSDFPNPGVHTLSVWLNEDPGLTLLISDNFNVSVSS